MFVRLGSHECQESEQSSSIPKAWDLDCMLLLPVPQELRQNGEAARARHGLLFKSQICDVNSKSQHLESQPCHNGTGMLPMLCSGNYGED